MLPDDATPQVDCLIALTMAEHPGTGRTRQWGMHDATKAFIPWDGELEGMYRAQGRLK